MSEYKERGAEIRNLCKSLVVHFMKATHDCKPGEAGLTQSEIFRACGFDWGEYKKVTTTNQIYWVVAVLRELESEEKVEQISDGGPWRLI